MKDIDQLYESLPELNNCVRFCVFYIEHYGEYKSFNFSSFERHKPDFAKKEFSVMDWDEHRAEIVLYPYFDKPEIWISPIHGEFRLYSSDATMRNSYAVKYITREISSILKLFHRFGNVTGDYFFRPLVDEGINFLSAFVNIDVQLSVKNSMEDLGDLQCSVISKGNKISDEINMLLENYNSPRSFFDQPETATM
jgi:hypothetical protein